MTSQAKQPEKEAQKPLNPPKNPLNPLKEKMQRMQVQKIEHHFGWRCHQERDESARQSDDQSQGACVLTNTY